MDNLTYFIIIIGFMNLGFRPSEPANPPRTSCGIADILEAQKLPVNSYAVTSYGNYEEASEVIVPVKLETGMYSEHLTRKGDNLYKVDGVNLFIKTTMSYEYAYGQEAIIEIESYGGEVTFK